MDIIDKIILTVIESMEEKISFHMDNNNYRHNDFCIVIHNSKREKSVAITICCNHFCEKTLGAPRISNVSKHFDFSGIESIWREENV